MRVPQNQQKNNMFTSQFLSGNKQYSNQLQQNNKSQFLIKQKQQSKDFTNIPSFPSNKKPQLIARSMIFPSNANEIQSNPTNNLNNLYLNKKSVQNNPDQLKKNNDYVPYFLKNQQKNKKQYSNSKMTFYKKFKSPDNIPNNIANNNSNNNSSSSSNINPLNNVNNQNQNQIFQGIKYSSSNGLSLKDSGALKIIKNQKTLLSQTPLSPKTPIKISQNQEKTNYMPRKYSQNQIQKQQKQKIIKKQDEKSTTNTSDKDKDKNSIKIPKFLQRNINQQINTVNNIPNSSQSNIQNFNQKQTNNVAENNYNYISNFNTYPPQNNYNGNNFNTNLNSMNQNSGLSTTINNSFNPNGQSNSVNNNQSSSKNIIQNSNLYQYQKNGQINNFNLGNINNAYTNNYPSFSVSTERSSQNQGIIEKKIVHTQPKSFTTLDSYKESLNIAKPVHMFSKKKPSQFSSANFAKTSNTPQNNPVKVQHPNFQFGRLSSPSSFQNRKRVQTIPYAYPKKQFSLRDFQMLNKIGKGAFGDVFLAKQLTIGLICVLKKVSKRKIKQQNLEESILRQIKIQSYLKHRHLTQIFGYFSDSEYIYLILQYLPDGSLNYVKKNKKVPQIQASRYIRQICQGLRYMHKQQIIHRDLKPQNIFINQDYLKIGDFGCAVFTQTLRRTIVGCLAYISPQQLNNQSYDDKIDVWCIGILTYELVTGKPPFEADLMKISRQQIQPKLPQLKFPQDLLLSEHAKDFMSRLLQTVPQNRMNIQQAMKHSFITKTLQLDRKQQQQIFGLYQTL